MTSSVFAIEGHAADNALAFFHEDNLIGLDILERVNGSARPPDFQQLDLLRFANPKTHPQMILQKIPPAAYFLGDGSLERLYEGTVMG